VFLVMLGGGGVGTSTDIFRIRSYLSQENRHLRSDLYVIVAIFVNNSYRL
jgi:hypothetical protein